MGHNRNSVQYYWRQSDSGTREKYIKRSEEELARKLAQKDYAIKLIKFATKRKLALENYNSDYSWSEIEKFHERFSPERQALITPFVLSDEEYAEQWKRNNGIKSCGIPGYPLDESTGIMIEDGGLVRSKSEKILADKLYMMNIPYVYEKPLCLGRNTWIYPDFTVLNRFTREEYYWEHFGMMDKQAYCENAINKIYKYQRNNIYQGKKLIVTFESSTRAINVREIEGIIDEFLLKH